MKRWNEKTMKGRMDGSVDGWMNRWMMETCTSGEIDDDPKLQFLSHSHLSQFV